MSRHSKPPETDIRITSNTFGAAGDTGIAQPAPVGGVGETLRAAREALRLSVDDVATALKIKPAFLSALEIERYDLLPTVTHAKGFLRSYAQYLGLGDRTENLLALYQRATVPGHEPAALSMPMPLPEGKLPTARVIGGTLVAAAVLCFLWYGFQASPPPATIAPPPAEVEKPAPAIVGTIAPPPAPVAAPVETPVAAAPAEAQQTPAAPVAEPAAAPIPTIAAPVTPATPPAPVPVATPTATPEPVDGTLRIRAIADSWIEVQDRTGATIFSRLMKSGQEYQVVPEPGLRMTTGNGAGVVIVRDGKAGAPLGGKAEVVRNISLSAKPAHVVKPAPAVAAPKPHVAPAPVAAPADSDAPPEETD